MGQPYQSTALRRATSTSGLDEARTGGPSVQLKRQVAGMGVADQRDALRPAMPLQTVSSAPASTATETGAVQAKADEAVQFRNAKAKEAYKDFNLEGTGLDEDHIFNGEIKKGVPKGLHAYGGSPPSGFKILATLGNTGKVHTIIWTGGAAVAAKKAKWSGMFPTAMSKGIACYYLSNGPGVVADGFREKPHRAGTGFNSIDIGRAGDTAYPKGGPSYQDACRFDSKSNSWLIDHDGTTYTITN